MTITARHWLALTLVAMLGTFTFQASAQDHAAPAEAAHTQSADDHADQAQGEHHGNEHGDEHGDEHGHGHGAHVGGGTNVIPTVNEGLISGIMTLIVFVGVLFVLGSQVWPKIQGSLQEREDKIRDEIQAAELARQQARDALEEYERSLAQARAEAQEMLDATRAQQAEMAAELKAKADVQLGEMREKAQRDIEAAKRAALNEIYDQAASLATLAAGKILQRELQPSDQQRLVDESLSELSAAQKN